MLTDECQLLQCNIRTLFKMKLETAQCCYSHLTGKKKENKIFGQPNTCANLRMSQLNLYHWENIEAVCSSKPNEVKGNLCNGYMM